MSLKTQSKVLRTLDEQRFTPVGGSEPITVDVRVIAATNKDLEEEISKGNFREDLFYRLNVIPFFVPPLRERKEDIPLLARHFLKEFAAAYGRRSREITDDAIEALMRYSWPGNVRELRNVIERIVIMNPTTTRFERKHLPPLVYRDGSRRAAGAEFSTLHQARDAYERDYILKKLDENHGNVSRTAEMLGLERSHLYRKMKSSGNRGEGMSVGAGALGPSAPAFRSSAVAAGMQDLSLHHVDLCAVVLELHFVHQLVDQENAAAMIGVDVFAHAPDWGWSGIKTVSGIAHHDQHATRLVAGHIALDNFLGIRLRPVHDRIGQRFA